jgi:predicted transcriptional regulator
LRTSLADKAASLASTEERLQREQDARQQAGAQLQQGRAALAEAWAALERERLAREEVQGRLQQERAALEGAQATLKQRDEEVSWLNGELTQLSVSYEDLRQSLKEQDATVLSLRQAAEDAREALEADKKQVEGELRFACPLLVGSTCLGSAPNFCFSFVIFRLADRPGELDDPGSGYPDGLQLLSTGVGGAAGRRPRGVPGGRGR